MTHHMLLLLLAAVYNYCSFSTGEFPDQLKPAHVTPKFKKGDKFDVKNYRPVSVLPTRFPSRLNGRF
jgi:hypothetical protein